LYQKALEGKIPEFTGISAPYEEPLNPELVLDTTQLSVHDAAQKVLELLKNHTIIQ